MSHRRSWWTRRSPRTPASLAESAGLDRSFEQLENRMLLSDPGSTFAEAQELTLDGGGQATYDDALPDTDDIDMYKFTVSSPDFITILADAVNAGDDYDDRVDTQITVYDYQGNVVGTSQDSGELTGGTPIDAWYGFVPTAAHQDAGSQYTFYVRVSAETGPLNSADGLYTIRVDGISTELTDDGTDAEQDVNAALSRPLEDVIYKLETGSGTDYDSVATAGVHADPDELDTRIDIYDSEGNLVAGDSQSGRLTNAFAVFKGEQDETYYFRVRADEYAPGRPTTGDYTMTLDMIGSTIDLDPVSRIGYVAGDQAGENVTELFKITPLATGLTIISVEGLQTAFPALTDPAITLYDDQGDFIAFSDRFFGESPQIATYLEGGRSYYAIVDGFEIAARSTFHILVEANHTFDSDLDLDDHADSLDFDNATAIVWSDWQVAQETFLFGEGDLTDHSLVSIGSFSGRIHTGSDTDVFVFVPPVDMLGQYTGNIGEEVDDDSDGLVDRDGDAAVDGAPIPWYEGYRPATRVEIQVQAMEDPGLPEFTWADMMVRVYDSNGDIVYAINDSTWSPAVYQLTGDGLNDPAGSLDPARYYADLDVGAVGIDFAGGATPFDGVFSLEVWGGEPYYIEVSTSSGSGRYNAFVAVDGFPDPTDEDNWSTIESDEPVADDSFDGIADDTGTTIVSGFIESTNNFNNDTDDFNNAYQIDLSIADGGWTGPEGSATTLGGYFLDDSAFFERAYVMGAADYPTLWTFPRSIGDQIGATLLAGKDVTPMGDVMGLNYDNSGVTILQQSGLAGIEHPLDNDLYTFRADSTGFVEVRVNTTQITDWYDEWIADGVAELVDRTDVDDDDFGFDLDDEGEVIGEFIDPEHYTFEKTYNSILDSALRIFDNDFEEIAFNNDNTAMTGVTETRNAGNQGEYTFHERDAYVVFPVVKGQVYYIQVESGQAEQYQAWRDDETLSVQWQNMIGSYELILHSQITQTNDDYPGATNVNSPVLAIGTDGVGTVSGEIDNNVTVPADSDAFTFIAPASAEFSVTVSRQTGETLIPTLAIYRETTGGGVELLNSATASSDGVVTLSADATKGERFYLEVFGAGSTEGLYDIEVSGLEDVDDHTDWLQFQAAEEIELLDFLGAGEATGSIESNGDSDVFKLQTADITDAVITVSSTTGELDTYIEVYEVGVDPFGNAVNLRIAYNDDIDEDTSDSQVMVGLTPNRVSGITGLEYPFYYLVVRGSDADSDEGDYEIDIDVTVTDDHADLDQYEYATNLSMDSETGQGEDTGIIEVEGDSDLFTFTALAGGSARVTVGRPTTSNFLPRLRVIDEDGNDLATESDGTVPGTVEVDVTRGGVYYIVVDAATTATDAQDTGAYTLTIVGPPLDDYPNGGEWNIAHVLSFDRDTGDAVLGTDEIDNPLNPRIDVVGDTDLFTFVTIAAGSFTITFQPLDTSIIGLHPELSVYDADQALIQTVSDTTAGVPVSIVLSDVELNAQYFVLVGDSIGNRTGDYKLTVDGPAGSGGGGGGGGGEIDFDTASQIDLDPFNADGSANGVISEAGERDLFTFEAPAGGTIFVQLITPTGSLLDGTITVLDAESEEAVVTSDATGIPGVDAAVSFSSAGAGQEYWVIVDGIGTGVGSYTIRIDAEPEVFRVFYPAGFTGSTIREFVSLANPNDFDITYSVILHYETGSRDQTIVSSQTLGAGSRGGVTISDALNGSPVGARIAPYAIEVQAIGGPIAASMGHFDFGSTTGDAFTSVISPIWSLARLERNPGSVNDFVLYFNPHDFDIDVTLTAYDASGDEVAVTVTVGALRRGGLNLNEVLSLPTGIFGAVVTAEASDSANDAAFQGVIVGQSHYDLVDESGFGLLGDPIGGSLSGAVSSMVQGDGTDSELVLFNPNPFVTTVTLSGQYVRADLPDLARILSLQPGETVRLTGDALGLIDEQPLGIAYSANFPITVASNQAQYGDSDSAAAASQAGTGWFYGAAFMNSKLAGESYYETLALYNPASTSVEVSVNLYFYDGTSDILKVIVGAGQFSEVRLHETLGSEFEANDNRPDNYDTNEILGRPGLSYFSMFVTAPTPIATSFTHYDLFLQGGWTNSGAALGLVNPISSIV